MRKAAVFAGLLTLTASTSYAETVTPPASPGAAPAAASQPAAPGPANLCRELVAFMQAPPPAPAPTAAAPAKPATTSPSGEAVPQKPPSATGSAQDASGHSGPAHEAPKQHTGAASETGAHKAELKSGLSAPVPKAPATAAKEAVLTVEQAQALAGANDIRACRDAARKLRLAGVAMPPPLLALTALDLQYQQTAAPR
jgi:hypothetical protein